jgi:hypothetical protein
MATLERLANRAANKIAKKVFNEVQRESRRLAQSREAENVTGDVQLQIHNYIMNSINDILYR